MSQIGFVGMSGIVNLVSLVSRPASSNSALGNARSLPIQTSPDALSKSLPILDPCPAKNVSRRNRGWPFNLGAKAQGSDHAPRQ